MPDLNDATLIGRHAKLKRLVEQIWSLLQLERAALANLGPGIKAPPPLAPSRSGRAGTWHLVSAEAGGATNRYDDDALVPQGDALAVDAATVAVHDRM